MILRPSAGRTARGASALPELVSAFRPPAGGRADPARRSGLRVQRQERRGSTMIEVESLTKRYGRATAVDGVSFRVEKGEILGFLGPNGAGKTTTMRILTCYLPPTDGTARVAGYD